MPLKLIQTGMGAWGVSWAKIIGKSPKWRQVAFVNPDNRFFKELADEYSADRSCCYTDLSSALKEIEADALLVTGPYFSHADATIQALRAGLHVLVEKPMADSLANAQRMARAAQESGLKLMVAENYRYTKAARGIRKLIEEQSVGLPEFVSIEYCRQHVFARGDWRAEMEHPLILENSVHHFDLIRYILGQEPLRIWAKTQGAHPDVFHGATTASIIGDMSNGTTIDYYGTWDYSAFQTPFTGNWKIRCSKGGISWEEGKIAAVNDNGETIDAPLIEMNCEDRAYILDEFGKAIEDNREPETNGEDNLKTFTMAMAAIESSRTGKPVEFSTSGSDKKRNNR